MYSLFEIIFSKLFLCQSQWLHGLRCESGVFCVGTDLSLVKGVPPTSKKLKKPSICEVAKVLQGLYSYTVSTQLFLCITIFICGVM